MAANGYKGTVTAGSGTTYTMTLTDVDGTVTTGVTVTALNIGAGETIPTGTQLIVIKIGNNYYCQPPVFL